MKIRIALLAVVAALALAGCGPVGDPGPGSFPINGRDATPDGCAVEGQPMPVDAVPAVPPIAVPPKMVADFRVVLNALTNDETGRYCTPAVPFAGVWDAHLYATANGQSVFASPTGGTLPWDGAVTSPWTSHLYLRYEIGSPIVVTIDFSAKLRDGYGQLPQYGAGAGCFIEYGGRGPNGGNGIFAAVGQTTIHHLVGADFLKCHAEIPIA
jgi:hypothetical protein